jgi:hypothetical protein
VHVRDGGAEAGGCKQGSEQGGVDLMHTLSY